MKVSRSAGAAPLPLAVSRPSGLVGDFVALTKPRLNLLVVITSAAGYYLGQPLPFDFMAMAETVAGTALVASGAAVLNQVYERDTDRLMRRTRMRPLPDGRVRPVEARWFGALLAVAGLGLLAHGANWLATLLALITILVYLVLYTPMKRTSSLSTLVGAIPGALPPLIGWAAARGDLSVGGWTLFAIVFLWQIPHFMAIAWMYRDDYRNAGFPLLPVVEPDGERTGQQAVIYSMSLIPVSLVPFMVGMSGWIYLWTAIALGLALLLVSWRFSSTRTDAAARALFLGSITYLPLLWAAMILNH